MARIEELQARLESLTRESRAALDGAAGPADVEAIRVGVLGRKGTLTALAQSIGSLATEDRPAAGALVNATKDALEEAIGRRAALVSEADLEARLAAEAVDVTLPGRRREPGARHPLSIVTDDLLEIFRRMGFSVATGPEVETVWHNFEALNIPESHPAREEMDTLYVEDGLVLRTHTSPGQIRAMEAGPPPVRVVCPGRVYRADAPDASHSPFFHQVEGLWIDEGISMAHLKWALTTFVHELYGPDTQVRFRASYFPFTEPSAELDIQCTLCGGAGCRACKQSGWMELLGCGMVHPSVLEAVGYDAERWTGFAWGMGVERIAMNLYGVPDIRLFYENDLRFLERFGAR